MLSKPLLPFYLFVKRHGLRAMLLTMLLSLMGTMVALAAGGDLDTTFSGDGKQITNIGGALNNDYGRGVAIQPDGKIVVVGEHFDTFGPGGMGNFAVARYLSTGALDTAFSGDGKLTTNLGDFGQALSVAIQPDGKIVVAGNAIEVGGKGNLAVVRYKPRGALDTTFSRDGKFLLDDGVDDNGTYGGLAIQPDGKILICGYLNNGSNYDIAVYRLDANGSLDPTFKGKGRASVDFGMDDTCFDMALQPDGKILVVAALEDDYMKIARFNTDGTLDTAFSGDGKQTISFGSTYNLDATAIAVQEDGKILIAGTAYAADSFFAVARLKLNGALDTTFSGDGRQITNLGTNEHLYDLVIQSDGKIVTVGSCGEDGSRDFALVRYRSTGALDTSFSGDGKLLTSFGGDDFASAVTLQDNGRIVVVGRLLKPLGWDFALARYLP